MPEEYRITGGKRKFLKRHTLARKKNATTISWTKVEKKPDTR